MITYLFFGLLAVIIAWRVILPGMKFEKTSTATVPTTGTTTGASAGAVPSTKQSMTDQLKSNVWTILLIVIGGGLVLWGIFSPVRVADVAKWQQYWFSLVVLWGVLAVLIAIHAEGATKTLQLVLAGVMLSILIIMPAVNLWVEETPSQQSQTQQSQQENGSKYDCTATSRCVPTMLGNGSTVKVVIPDRTSVCFDPRNIQDFGIKTSYKGGPEKGFEGIADTFWFVLKEGQTPPKYWFVQEGTKQC